MCGIAGFIHLNNQSVEGGSKILTCMGELLAHRGPDGEGSWLDDSGKVGLAHRRLAIIDLSSSGAQPMKGRDGTLITLNGEIYNYLELQESLRGSWDFTSDSDTETVLASYDRYGEECVDHLRGMFSFAIWDDRKQRLFCARDRFGIKPFYYTTVDDVFYFASEAKALLPVLLDIETDGEAMAEYLTFNFVIGENTLFKGIKQLLPGHGLMIKGGEVRTWRYWDVNYEVDWDHGEGWFQERLRSLLDDSIGVHLRSDVPVGAYLSGGIDSSLMAILAARKDSQNREAFHGRFLEYPGYDESNFAEMASEAIGGNLNVIDITHKDFEENFRKVIYHLDYP
ncbi:MAG: asparagine synthase (glutamine-hydrolyzing), partial [Opitutales bacterium]